MPDRITRSAGILLLLAACSTPAEQAPPPAETPAATAPDPIANAESSAIREIAAGATILGWAANPSDPPVTLREGTNGWTCFPDVPMTSGPDPMCLDAPWMSWLDAYFSKQAFKAERVGFGYMLAGDSPASNTDPYATGPTADNEWMEHATPHVMMIVPDVAALGNMPVQPGNGPWLMWRDTPYAHVMIPLEHR